MNIEKHARAMLFVAAAAGASLPAAAVTMLAQTTGPNGNVYQLWHAPDQISWADAEANAVALGGHLASIADSAENLLVADLAAPFAQTVYIQAQGNQFGPYLGGYRLVPGGPFLWSDGTPFVYTNWLPSEPNNTGGLENHIHMLGLGSDPFDEPGEGGFWNDVGPNGSGSNLMIAYIVELPAAPAVPEPSSWVMLIAGFGLIGAALRRRRFLRA